MMMARLKLADCWVMTHSLALADLTVKDSQGVYSGAFLTGRSEINHGVRNIVVRKRTDQCCKLLLKTSRLRWFGHICCMSRERLPKALET